MKARNLVRIFAVSSLIFFVWSLYAVQDGFAMSIVGLAYLSMLMLGRYKAKDVRETLEDHYLEGVSDNEIKELEEINNG